MCFEPGVARWRAVARAELFSGPPPRPAPRPAPRRSAAPATRTRRIAGAGGAETGGGGQSGQLVHSECARAHLREGECQGVTTLPCPKGVDIILLCRPLAWLDSPSLKKLPATFSPLGTAVRGEVGRGHGGALLRPPAPRSTHCVVIRCAGCASCTDGACFAGRRAERRGADVPLKHRTVAVWCARRASPRLAARSQGLSISGREAASSGSGRGVERRRAA